MTKQNEPGTAKKGQTKAGKKAIKAPLGALKTNSSSPGVSGKTSTAISGKGRKP